jgi:hypothetical protein
MAVGVLALALCLGVVLLFVGWEPFRPGFSLTGTGWAAMAIGLLAALLLCVGLTLLILDGKRKG